MKTILQKLYELLAKLLPLVESQKKQEVIDNVPLPTEPIIPKETPKSHSTAWAVYPSDLKLELIGEVRKICVDVGLSQSLTQDLIYTIQAESGWNPFCENTRTFDYGLCQFSKKYYLIEYKMTPQYAKEHPLECARIMAKNFPTRKNNWVAYLKGMYKTWSGYTDEQLANYKPTFGATLFGGIIGTHKKF